MPKSTGSRTPKQKAEQAAEELAAAGRPVTGRSVREKAGVSMRVASEVAGAWNEKAAGQVGVPDAPKEVQSRLDGIWGAAYVAARDEFTASRDRLQARFETDQKEIAALTKVVTELEEKLAQEQEDGHQAQRTAARELTDAQDRATRAETQAAKAEGALEAVTTERDRLLVELESARTTATDD